MSQSKIQFDVKRNYTPLIIVFFIMLGLWLFIEWATDGSLHWVDLLFPLISLFLMLFDYWNIHYRMENGILYIKSGWTKLTIPASKIRKIKAVKSWSSAPATSYQRLELTYNKYSTTSISPSDVAGFVAAVQAENPAVDVVV
jgi:hypothetical protein